MSCLYFQNWYRVLQINVWESFTIDSLRFTTIPYCRWFPSLTMESAFILFRLQCVITKISHDLWGCQEHVCLLKQCLFMTSSFITPRTHFCLYDCFVSCYIFIQYFWVFVVFQLLLKPVQAVGIRTQDMLIKLKLISELPSARVGLPVMERSDRW